MRTAARECAFKAVFASVFTGETDSGLIKSMIKADKLDEDDCAYLNRVISLVGGHREELLRLLDRHSRSPRTRAYFWLRSRRSFTWTTFPPWFR